MVTFSIRGATIAYDAKTQEIAVHGHRAKAPLLAGKQRLTIFCDRTGLEVFASDGFDVRADAIHPRRRRPVARRANRGRLGKFHVADGARASIDLADEITAAPCRAFGLCGRVKHSVSQYQPAAQATDRNAVASRRRAKHSLALRAGTGTPAAAAQKQNSSPQREQKAEMR